MSGEVVDLAEARAARLMPADAVDGVLQVSAERGLVCLVDEPGGVELWFTPDAAERLIANVLGAVLVARGQR